MHGVRHLDIAHFAGVVNLYFESNLLLVFRSTCRFDDIVLKSSEAGKSLRSFDDLCSVSQSNDMNTLKRFMQCFSVPLIKTFHFYFFFMFSLILFISESQEWKMKNEKWSKFFKKRDLITERGSWEQFWEVTSRSSEGFYIQWINALLWLLSMNRSNHNFEVHQVPRRGNESRHRLRRTEA